MGVKLLVYDRTCMGSRDVAGAVRGVVTAEGTRAIPLSRAWSAGSVLYRAVGRIDASCGVASWGEALGFLETACPGEPIDEIQYWGHGRWGRVLVDEEALDAASLSPTHAYARNIDAVRERLSPSALVWFRTCETFGATDGRELAARLADRLGARVAGHTYVIGFYQSGLFGLRPGDAPYWPGDHGLAEGAPDRPVRARVSTPGAPRTLTCLGGRVPETWFSPDA